MSLRPTVYNEMVYALQLQARGLMDCMPEDFPVDVRENAMRDLHDVARAANNAWRTLTDWALVDVRNSIRKERRSYLFEGWQDPELFNGGPDGD